jgi:Cu/Ag efflux protein CusF
MPSQSLRRVRGLMTWSKPTIRAHKDVTRPARNIRDGAFGRRYLLRWRASFVLSLVAFTGCAAYTPPPLTTQHPAHPEATATPLWPPSTTLAYRPSDVPSPRPAVPVGQRGRQGTPTPGPKSAHTVVGEGKVIAVVPGSSELVLTHSEIKDFMEPMTMGYQVAPPSLLQGVQAGDAVRFTIDTQQKAIVKLEKLSR